MSKLVWVALSFILILGCSKKTATESDAEDAVGTAVGALAGAVNMQNTGADVGRREITACNKAAAEDDCDVATKTKTATYTDCPIGSSELKFSGTVTLTYSAAACNMLVNDSSVVRSLNISRDGLLDSMVTTSSDAHNDYRGNSIGGGQKLTKTSDGFTMEVLGIHKVRTSSTGTKTFDISFRTTDAFEIAISDRSTAVTNGTLEVIHNLAEYTATFSSEDLTFTSGCCYPTSGTVAVAYTGSITGTATVTFESCGTASFERNGSVKEVTLPGCE